MRLTTPRIMPAADNGLTEEQREIVAPIQERGPVLNIFRTLLNHPAAAKGFLGWGRYVLSRNNTLPPREREIVILRTGFLCRSGYEWTQHVPIGKRAGLTGTARFRFHDLRHDGATKVLRDTGNLKLTAELLDHANVATVSKTYAHVTQTDKADALERLAHSRNQNPLSIPRSGKLKAG